MGPSHHLVVVLVKKIKSRREPIFTRRSAFKHARGSQRAERALFQIHMSLSFCMCVCVSSFTPAGVRVITVLYILVLISPRMQYFPVPLALMTWAEEKAAS